MNEKIKQLKLNAGIESNPDQEGLDLFAKLVIDECLDVLRKHTLKGAGLPENYNGKVIACEIIKEHFNKQ